ISGSYGTWHFTYPSSIGAQCSAGFVSRDRPRSGTGADRPRQRVLGCDSRLHIDVKARSSSIMRLSSPRFSSVAFLVGLFVVGVRGVAGVAGVVGVAAAEPQPVVAPATSGSYDVQRGPDLAGVDRSVKPGDDFDLFANGTWKSATPIPADKAAAGPSTELFD